MAGAGFLAGGVLFSGFVSPAQAAISTRNRSKKNDVKILNYALTLEYLESTFYNEANASGALTDQRVREFAKVTGAHENAHVKALKAALGSAAVKKPKFDFGETVTSESKFKDTAQVLEDTGVAAYAGQGPNLLQRPVVKVALAIHSVEGATPPDPLHQLGRRSRPGLRRRSGAEGVRPGPQREGRAEGGHGDRLHPVASRTSETTTRGSRIERLAERDGRVVERGAAVQLGDAPRDLLAVSASACARGRTPRR